MGNMIGQSMADFNPGAGKTTAQRDKVVDKLMSTTAADAKDTMTGTNELKAYEGGKGVPPGPFGLQGKEF